MSKHRLAGAAAAAAALALVVACHKSDTAPSVTGTTQSYVSGAAVGTTSAVFTGAAAPAANGGPTIVIAGNSNVINGGTELITIASVTEVTHLYVFVSTLTGYYDVVLPAPATNVTLVVSFAQAPPTTTFTLSVSGVSASGSVGTPASIASTVTSVGTGDLQVSLAWDINSDLDLHVVEPSGEEIYWNNRASATGGKLDLDSNAACNYDGIRNENVTWPTGTAPRGTYTVRVDQWSSCGAASTNYIVRVNVGGTSSTYSGTFTGTGDKGGRGSGSVITTFAY